MSTGDPPDRFTGAGGPFGGHVVMYGAAPINEPYPGINPWPPPGPLSPFTPGVQPVPATTPQPPFTVGTAGPEPIEQIAERVRTRIAEVKQELRRLNELRDELAGLELMLETFEKWHRAPPSDEP